MSGRDAARARWLGAVAILALGAALRLLASTGDLWLDEIWSLAQVGRAAGELDVLLIGHDNSHPLNALYLYALGGHAPQIAYRLLALASGLVAVVVAFRIGARQGTPGSLLAGAAIALSFPMILYSSEARGYMSAVAAAFCAFVLVERLLVAPRWRTRVAFWGTSIAGLLSHYVFIEVLIALAAWSAWCFLVRAPDRRAGIVSLAQMHLVPFVALGVLYVAVLSRLRVGGGPHLPLATLAGQTVGWAIGLPVEWMGGIVGAILVLLVMSAEASAMRRDGDESWIFYLLIVVLIPVLVVMLRPPLLYPRYFLLNTAFLLLALASLTARLLRRGGVGALVAAVVILVYCAGNASRDAWFLRDGRGDFRTALAWIAEESAQPRVLVTSSNDFAVRHEIGFHGRAVPGGERIVYQAIRSLPRRGTDWLIVRRELADPEPENVVEDPHGNRYVLRRRFPSYGPSGADWYVYARA